MDKNRSLIQQICHRRRPPPLKLLQAETMGTSTCRNTSIDLQAKDRSRLPHRRSRAKQSVYTLCIPTPAPKMVMYVSTITNHHLPKDSTSSSYKHSPFLRGEQNHKDDDSSPMLLPPSIYITKKTTTTLLLSFIPAKYV